MEINELEILGKGYMVLAVKYQEHGRIWYTAVTDEYEATSALKDAIIPSIVEMQAGVLFRDIYASSLLVPEGDSWVRWIGDDGEDFADFCENSEADMAFENNEEYAEETYYPPE